MADNDLMERRPIQSRSSTWAVWLAKCLAGTQITPNQISVASVVISALGALCILWGTMGGFVMAAVCIQLRLICNLMDGMVAIEGGKASNIGALYNELPDRVADSMLLVAAGYVAGASWLGWLCALLACATAYIRLFGGALGLPQNFGGLLPKQRRMFLLTVGLLLAALLRYGLGGSGQIILLAVMGVMALGTVVTCVTRVDEIRKLLEQTP